MTYTYDPELIGTSDKDRLRFELGDTVFAPAELTAALSDEEYNGVIASTISYRQAKLQCLKAILAKFAHQPDMEIDGLTYNFSKRVKLWRELLKDLEQGTNLNPLSPMAKQAIKARPDYFYPNMLKNWGE